LAIAPKAKHRQRRIKGKQHQKEALHLIAQLPKSAVPLPKGMEQPKDKYSVNYPGALDVVAGIGSLQEVEKARTAAKREVELHVAY